jgi:outer membrane immunogenic protein
MSKVQFAAIAGVAFLLAAGAASAAPYQFSGFYAGGHFGYIDAHAEVNSDGTSDGGLMGGLQAGYNFIDGSLMYGIETDVSLLNADPDGGCDYIGGSCDFDIGPMATFRGRVGFAADDFLVFVTGGVAAASYDMTSFDGQCVQVDDLDTFGKFGWTAGAGVEYLLGDMMSVKLEYRYIQLFEADFQSFQAGQTEIDMEFHTIMAGVNWHF